MTILQIGGDISIRELCKGCEAFEVIAHDVFIYPEFIAKYIEGLFYINKKNLALWR